MAQGCTAMVLSKSAQTIVDAAKKPWRLIVFVIFFAILTATMHQPIARASYVLGRDAEIAHTRWRLRDWPHLNTAHFDVYYVTGQEPVAKLVLRALTQALPFEQENLQIHPKSPLTIVIYPTLQAMNQSVGEQKNANNIGYDYNGVVDILSPTVWLGKDARAFDTFLKQGPSDHELGHALLNLKADGNYPSWFNEGVAQYEDYRVTGYQWLTPTNALTGPLYSMAQLDGHFYALPNQSRAYREGLALVAYLQTVHGHATFVRFLNQLAQGTSFDQALARVYHLPSATALFAAWHRTLTIGPGHP